MKDTQRVAFEENGALRLIGHDRPQILTWRRSARARRLCLRAGAHGIELVVPAGASLTDAGNFALAHSGWILRQTEKLPSAELIDDGALIPVAGVDHQVVHRSDIDARGPNGERVIWQKEGALHVRGDAAHLPRRVEDWLRSKARARLSSLAATKAARIDRRPTRVSVRDTVSRWGSCSSAGALSFCWRLIMAPPWVLDYVTAHEVAHLRHMNHSPAFWRTCSELIGEPDDDDEVVASDKVVQRAQTWLRRNGSGLHAIRFRA